MKRTDDTLLAERLLDQCMFATLSLSEPDGTPYGIPVSPVRRGNRLFFHCAQKGRKIAAMRANPKVSVSCVGKTEVLPGEFNIGFQSMVATGTACEVTDEKEKIEVLRLICNKYCPDDMGGFQRELDKFLAHTGIWSITLEKITTKG